MILFEDYAPGTRTPRPRMVWNKPYKKQNKAIGCKACALTADEASASPARAIDDAGRVVPILQSING